MRGKKWDALEVALKRTGSAATPRLHSTPFLPTPRRRFWKVPLCQQPRLSNGQAGIPSATSLKRQEKLHFAYATSVQ